MTDTPPPQGWTPEKRSAAAARARLTRPWQYSTGPKTAQGKRISARNSTKHGAYRTEMLALRWIVRLCAQRLKQIKSANFEPNRRHIPRMEKIGNELSLYNGKTLSETLRFRTKTIKTASSFNKLREQW